MPTKIGPFEILSELAKSPTTVVYKANDPQSAQTIALKTIQLSVFGENAPALQECLLVEADSTKILSSSNITPIYGAGEIEGLFCAAMEYVQGNSIATMLARKEGFSIWDLLDIGRQVCSGLDHAHGHKVFHYSLEPSKIMCGWDGTVKILSFGVSSVGKFAAQMTDGVHSILYYMSPEQIRGEELTAASNLFSLGAMFYEMVTDRKPFSGEDVDALRRNILESEAVPPVQVNPKIHPLLSNLIMKALTKESAQRYQSGRELLDDLEKCKDSRSQTAAKPAAPPKGVVVPDKVKAAAASKFVAGASAKPARVQAVAPKPSTAAGVKPSSAGSSGAGSSGLGSKSAASMGGTRTQSAVPPKAAAAAASSAATESLSYSAETPKVIDASAQFIASDVNATIDASAQQNESMSAAVADEPGFDTPEASAPNIAVDPMMAEGGGPSRGTGTSFSEIDELPPLKEVYIAPPPPPVQEEAPVAPHVFSKKQPEKPKVQPREVAQKAMKEIKNVPPQLMIYSIAGAVILILAMVAGIAFYIHHQNSDDDAAAPQPAAAAPASDEAATAPAPAAQQQEQPAAVAESETPSVESEQPAVPSAPARGRGARKKSAPAPVVIPGQMAVDSTPQGAQVQIDGRSDPAWATPYTMVGLTPGQHMVTVSKAGYAADTRAVNVSSGSKSFIAIHLAPLMATLSVNSSPAGANVFVDGKDTRKITPAQFNMDKGLHVVLVRKSGYLDETSNPQLVQGQTSSFSPSLRPLGNADDIKTVGKFKKMFGKNGSQGMVTVSVKTQPKGAQVAVNQHMLEKASPVDFALDPGNYVIDITLSDYVPIHKVITVDKGGKVVVDEIMQRQ